MCDLYNDLRDKFDEIFDWKENPTTPLRVNVMNAYYRIGKFYGILDMLDMIYPHDLVVGFRCDYYDKYEGLKDYVDKHMEEHFDD